MVYYELPTKKKQAIVTAIVLIGYGAVFYGLKTRFPDVPEDMKLFLSQYGLLVIFVSALLASIGVFWSAKVRHNKDVAESEMRIAETNLAILKSQAEQLQIDLSGPIQENEGKLKIASQRLQEVEDHPSFINWSAGGSIFVLALGTLMCVVGAG